MENFNKDQEFEYAMTYNRISETEKSYKKSRQKRSDEFSNGRKKENYDYSGEVTFNPIKIVFPTGEGWNLIGTAFSTPFVITWTWQREVIKENFATEL